MTVATEQQDWDLIPPAVRAKMEEISKFTSPDPNAPVEGEQPPVAGEPATEPAPAQVTPPEPQKEEAAPAEPAKPQSFSEVATEEMTKEQRYKIMEGMQKAIGRDLSRAQRETAALRDEVEALKQQIGARPAAPAAPGAPAAPAPSGKVDEIFSTEVMDAFGAKNVEELSRGMVQFLRSQGFVVSQDLQQVQQQVGQVGHVVAASAYERFEESMDGLTDGQWKAINADPRFVAWTSEPEGRTSIPRIEFMKKALASRDATALAPFFTDFVAEYGGAPEPATPAPPKASALDKKKFAAPKATPAAVVVTDGEKPSVKMSEFTKLEADVRAGKFTSDDPVKQMELNKQLAAEQARLNEAQRSGRMIPG